MNQTPKVRRKRKLRKARLLALILSLLGILFLTLFAVYQIKSSPVDKNSKADIEVVIESGMSTSNIAKTLVDKGIIKDALFFKVYLKLNRVSSLKAATYLLQKSMSLQEIVTILNKGNVSNPEAVTITFPEGKNIRQYAQIIEQATLIKADDFLAKMKDKTYLASLIEKYWFLTDSILDENIYYGLEGYLAPDTYEFKNKEVTIEEIVSTLLEEEASNLASFRNNMSNPHEIFTLASMAELEGVTEKDRKLIVGVFNNRLARGMNLGSDVTTYYAFQKEMTSDLTSAMFNTFHPYNTRSANMAGKLPIGPICQPSLESIKAAISPTKSDYLYFVADKNGVIYYTKTQAEHEAKVGEIKENGDWIW